MVSLFLATALSAASLDLSGEWRLALDAADKGLAAGPEGWRFNDTITLPNTLTTAGKGEPLSREPKLDKDTLRHLHQRYSHVGPAWYQREIDIPAEWNDKDVRLSLERVIWESRVWINGREVGIQDSLSTPHHHETGDLLEPGKTNTITIRIDNRKRLDIGIGHAYSNETQTIWNGIVGKITLDARPKARVESLRVRLDESARSLAVTAQTENTTDQPVSGKFELVLTGNDGKTLATHRRAATIPPGSGDLTATLKPESAPPQWSEFSPGTVNVRARFESDAGESEISSAAGFRSFTARDRGLFINGRPVFLRGTLECCIFPKTGHPDMAGGEWEKIMHTTRAHGLNHIRFHSWCPPRAAFDAADRHGVYLQVELPNWSFHMGQRPEVDEYFRLEGERIFREFGNHPSFVMFCLGNELKGDFAAMDRMVGDFKKIEPDLLMSSTAFSFSGRGKVAGPADDFFISQETSSGWVRGQGFINQTRPNTGADYADGLASMKVPLVTHEVGQYNNYPNLAELPKYKGGALRSLAYEAIRNDLAAKGLLEDAPRFTRNSGKLAALLYKEDMERAMRTKDLAGIQLLDLHDFPGQSTATVGILDAFWDSKGFISDEDFRRFAGPTVPLARMEKLVWENNETFAAKVEIAHFGAASMTDQTVTWSLTGADGRKLAGDRWEITEIPLGNGTRLGEIRVPLEIVSRPEQITLTTSVEGTEISNAWKIWVYPSNAPSEPPGEVLVLETAGERLKNALAAGRRVLLLPKPASLARPIDARFIPVFWSPLHFPNQPGTLGATIEADHPAFRSFPTSTHTDWQWWELFSTSHAMDLTGIVPRPGMPLRFIDKFDRNALPAAMWEAKVGAGKLFVCTLDVSSDLGSRPAARQLRVSLLDHVASADFAPAVELAPEMLDGMFRASRFAVSASGAHASHPAEAAVDGDSSTIWHTDWTAPEPQVPGWLAIDFGEPQVVTGLRYIPRQDLNRGRIARYRIDISPDGNHWQPLTEGTLPNDRQTREIAFEKPLKLRHVRLVGLSDHGGAKGVAIAGIEPLFKTADDVRDLGIIPGFNDGE